MKNERLKAEKSATAGDVVIDIFQTGQTTEGFGTCFNKLGLTSLSRLKEGEESRVLPNFLNPVSELISLYAAWRWAQTISRVTGIRTTKPKAILQMSRSALQTTGES